MDRYTDQELKEIHALVFELMCAFKEVCEKADIRYFLAGGTLLGAVREKGFIPWDTDADVTIFIQDKDKFRNAIVKYLDEKYYLERYDIDEKCTKSHDTLFFKKKPKYGCVHLDIFPLIGAPSNEKKQDKFSKWCNIINKVVKSKHVDIKDCLKKNRPLVLGAKCIDYLFPDSFLKNVFRKIENKYDVEKAEYYMTISNYGNRYNCIPKDVYSKSIELEFNGIRFQCPEDWDTYLSRYYGNDYMTPKKY